MSATRLHLLTERLSSLMRSQLRQVASAHDLKLVQLEALVYLSVANRYSDSPLALTEYFGVTKGTVSQTLKALERRGLIAKRQDPDDRRVQHCAVTPAGAAIVDEAYPSGCFRAFETASTEEHADALEAQLRALQRANGFKTFGQCRTCRHFQSRSKGLARSKGGRCGLTDELLSKSDTAKICREHEFPSGA